jgi:uncharacterized repeat protein (TIGR01451 family)
MQINKLSLQKILLMGIILTVSVFGVFYNIHNDNIQVQASSPDSSFCDGTTGDNGDGTNTLIVANTATVTSGITDPNMANNEDCIENPISYVADLSVTKDDGKTEILAGQENTYTITITNNGPSTVTSMTVNDTVPTQLNNPVFSVSQGSYDATTGSLTGISLASGQSMTMTLVGTVDANAAPGVMTNTVTVTVPDGVTDPTPDNNTDTDDTTIIERADLSLVKTLQGQLVSGTEATYVLTVTNNGPSAATNLVITDTLPDQLSYVSSNSTDGWACTESNNVVTCNYTGPLANGATSTLNIIVRVD